MENASEQIHQKAGVPKVATCAAGMKPFTKEKRCTSARYRRAEDTKLYSEGRRATKKFSYWSLSEVQMSVHLFFFQPSDKVVHKKNFTATLTCRFITVIN